MRGDPSASPIPRSAGSLEDPISILGTGHMYHPDAERVAMFIPENLCKHHRSKREKGLTKRVIGAKVGQSADMDFLRVSTPRGKKDLWVQLTLCLHHCFLSVQNCALSRTLCSTGNAPCGHPILSFMPLTRAYVFGSFKKSE